MQRQKTIAKWLAVILLLTLAIGCYIALSAIIKGGGDIVSGADNNANDNQDNNINNGDIDINNGSDDTTIILPPTYSSLPRRAETVNGMSVQHIGGESDDIMLDSVYFSNRQLIIFSTTSKEHDVKESGIYIAVLDDNTLLETIKIAEIHEEYLHCAITKSGLMIITKTSQTTTFKLYSTLLKLTAQNSTISYADINFYTHANELYAVAYDNDHLSVLSISSSLDIRYSNYVYPTLDATIKDIISYGNSTLIFIQTIQGVECILYNQNKGFTLQNSVLNASFSQILPIFANGEQYIILLTKDSESLSLYTLSSTLKQLSNCKVNTSQNGCIIPYENGIALVYENKLNTYCAHLDLLSIKDIECPSFSSNATLEYANDASNTILIKDNENLILCHLKDGVLSMIFECEYMDNSTNNNAIKDVIVARQNSTQFSHTIYLTTTNTSTFSYMCFGGRDVFSIALDLDALT